MDFSFSWFDIVVILMIVLISIKGIVSGFIKEFFSLVGVVGGIFIASRYAKAAGEFINDNIYTVTNGSAMQLIGFVALLLVVMFVAYLLGIAISKLVDLSGFSIVNKVLGFVFCGAKIFLVLAILTFAISSIEFIRAKISDALGESFMYNTLRNLGERIVDIDPGNITMPEMSNVSGIIAPVLDNANEIINNATQMIETISNMTNDTISNDTSGNQ